MSRTNYPRTVAAAAWATAGAAAASVLWRARAKKLADETAHLHRTLVDLLLNTLSAGDATTERHSRRVADLTDVLADSFGISAGKHSTLRIAALLHDMGKIDDRFFDILHSCSPLSHEDREKINDHPRESADILQPLESVHPGITEIVEAHHECWDGNGYPAGLKGEEIPLESRLISTADVFDALTQPRPYRDALPFEEALEEIRRGSGTRFDPAVIERLRSRDVTERWAAIVARGKAKEENGEAATGSPSRSDPSERR